MSLLPEDADYLEHLQAFFLAFRGDGVCLSALDAELLSGWKASGVPGEIVCRGIRDAAERLLRDAPQGARLRTLRSCRPSVEREFRRFQGLSTGRATAHPKPREQLASERLARARASLSRGLTRTPPPALAAALCAALSALEGPDEDPREVSRRIGRAEEVLALVFLGRWDPAARRRAVAESLELAGPRPRGSSPRARRDCLRACLIAVARARGDLPALG